MTHALIVIDVQNDFCPGGALAVPGGDEIVAPINAIMDEFNAVILTQDWHPAGHSSFASSHVGKNPFDLAEMPYGPQVLWPDHCVQGTQGAAFHPDLRIEGDLIIRKGFRSAIDSYSAFFENDRRTPTGLEYYLKGVGIRKVYLTGLGQDFCVYYSAKDALRLGLETIMVEDATRGLDQPEGSLAGKMEDLEESGLGLISSDHLLS